MEISDARCHEIPAVRFRQSGFSHDMAELFLGDLKVAIDWLDHLDGKLPLEQQPAGFSH